MPYSTQQKILIITHYMNIAYQADALKKREQSKLYMHADASSKKFEVNYSNTMVA